MHSGAVTSHLNKSPLYRFDVAQKCSNPRFGLGFRTYWKARIGKSARTGSRKRVVKSILCSNPRPDLGFERTVARSCHAPQKTLQPLSDHHNALWYTTTAQIQSLDKPTALLTMLHHPLLTAPHDRFKEDRGNWFFGRFFLLAVISSAWNAFQAQAATTPYVVVVSFASLLGGGWCACHRRWFFSIASAIGTCK